MKEKCEVCAQLFLSEFEETICPDCLEEILEDVYL